MLRCVLSAISNIINMNSLVPWTVLVPIYQHQVIHIHICISWCFPSRLGAGPFISCCILDIHTKWYIYLCVSLGADISAPSDTYTNMYRLVLSHVAFQCIHASTCIHRSTMVPPKWPNGVAQLTASASPKWTGATRLGWFNVAPSCRSTTVDLAT